MKKKSDTLHIFSKLSVSFVLSLFFFMQVYPSMAMLTLSDLSKFEEEIASMSADNLATHLSLAPSNEHIEIFYAHPTTFNLIKDNPKRFFEEPFFKAISAVCEERLDFYLNSKYCSEFLSFDLILEGLKKAKSKAIKKMLRSALIEEGLHTPYNLLECIVKLCKRFRD